jgi:preprotein translocase subunit SecG
MDMATGGRMHGIYKTRHRTFSKQALCVRRCLWLNSETIVVSWQDPCMESIIPFLRTALQILQILCAFVLIILVLIHSPKGDGIGSIGGSAQLFSSQKGAEAALNKITAYTAGAFYVISFALGYYLGY